MTKEQILQEAAALQEEIKSHRLWLHTHAETGFDLTETKPYVKSTLTEMGYTVQECGKAGLVTTVGKPGGKVLLLRADMDALPIAEEADVDFACKNGRMHACGHDMHTAMLLGAAKILKAHESELGGTVKLMFQPAEEIFEGSKDMIASGVLENPRPDAALMIHVAAGMPLPAGTVVVSAPGVSAPAADYFTIRVHGKGCHGSAPQNGIDPLTAAAHILIALQEIHARELSASDEAVLTIGTFHAGEAGNVIPDTATMGGTIRTYDEKTRAYLKERMTAIAQSIAEAFRASAEVSFGSGCPTLVNDKDLSEKVTGYLKGLLGASHAFTTAELNGGKPARGGGSEDFAYVSHEVPSLMLALAAGEPSKGYVYPQHHPKVKFDESVLSTGAAVFVDCALHYLSE
ncbi:MAG: M20 family metallopeptidase [Oscillospiraceae bacterium]|nr:M20 family metallopeptidase [Oscillospiraceae bacterium]